MMRGPLHNRGADGRCTECGDPFPCPTGIAIYEAVKHELEHPTPTETRRQPGPILLGDIDVDLLELLAFALRRAGLESIAAYDGPTVLRLFEEQQPSLVLLNIWRLPLLAGLSGTEELKKSALEVLKKLRQHSSQVPIIVLTAVEEENYKVSALEAGADDYVLAPFSHRDLIARIGGQLRRTGHDWPPRRNRSTPSP